VVFDGITTDSARTQFQRQSQLSQLRYTASSVAAATGLAENYVGLPFTGSSGGQ
jgi:p-hydroxybenzoate 3-monooxygenase